MMGHLNSSFEQCFFPKIQMAGGLPGGGCLSFNLTGTLYISSNRPLPIHSHSHEISKFLDTETLFLLNKCCQSANLFNFKGEKISM